VQTKWAQCFGRLSELKSARQSSAVRATATVWVHSV
jgi:hypothetical protein